MSKQHDSYHKLLIAGITLLFISIMAAAQIEHGVEPASRVYELPPAASAAMVVEPDKAMRQERDSLSGVQQPGVAPHAGFAIPASTSLHNHGQWEVAGSHLHVWRIHIESPEALATGINFSNFRLGGHARLYIYDPDKQVVLGGFDHRNNREDGKFTTAVIPGETLVIEYQEPYYPGKPEEMTTSTFAIESIIHLSYGGGLTTGGSERGLGESGDCMVNVNCSEGDDWQDEKRGIARMLMRTGSSYSWCTGSLVNTTAQDARPYFLSAEHCGRNATEEDLLYWQFYFNLELAGCENEGYPPLNMIYGADMLALGELEGGSDFRLLELHATPPPHWRPYWNGWDRTGDGSSSGVGIHHPRGDVKKISTYSSNLVSSAPLVSGQQMADDSAWRVIWTRTQNGHGVSEGGSSGSPIFNSEKKIIGTLTGGSSNCDNVHAPDYFGKIWYHWDQNGTDISQRLNGYLDPLGTGEESMPGFDPHADLQPPPGFMDASLDADENALLTWYAPGNAPNIDGWYRHVDDFTHLTWNGPERVSVFDAHTLGINYPLELTKIAHTFVEHGDHPWPDDQFQFIIYDTDGQTLLYESEELTAVHLQEYVYELPEPMLFNDYFYVGVKTPDASHHPSSLMKLVNFGQGYSFSGSAGDWQPHNDGQEGSFAYLFAIYVGEDHEEHNGDDQDTRISCLQNLHQENDHTNNLLKEQSLRMAAGIMPDSYRIYRDNELIHTAGFDEEMAFTDILPGDGFYRFHATAMYGNSESARSNTAYLLKTEACDEVINTWPYEEDFDHGFDDACWINEGLEGEGWATRESYNTPSGSLTPQSGDQFYLAEGTDTGLYDEWLITPAMDFTELEHPAMRFVFNGHGENGDVPPYLTMRVSDDGKSFEKMFDSRHYPGFDVNDHQPDWFPATVNLQRFSGREEVHLAFQFTGEQNGFFAIDHVEVLNGSAIAYNLTVNINPDNAGTVNGRGTYLAGERLRLHARPNVSYSFQSWLQGDNAISHQEDLQFIMPASNTQLTASFADLTTSVNKIIKSEKDILVFPNPATNQLRIKFNEVAHDTEITLIDLQGRILMRREITDAHAGREEHLQVGNLSRGVYFLHVFIDGAGSVHRVVLSD